MYCTEQILTHATKENLCHGKYIVRYARCLSSETMEYSHFKRKVRASGFSCREKMKRRKSLDISVLESVFPGANRYQLRDI